MPCDAIEDWYNAQGNISRECGVGKTGYFYDADRQIAWYVIYGPLALSTLREKKKLTFFLTLRGFETYQDKTFCDNVNWVSSATHWN